MREKQRIITLLVVTWFFGCQRGKAPDLGEAPQPIPVTFTDVTEQAGIHFVHNNGANGDKWLPETMGSGGCFLDYDGDDWQDIFLVNGRDWTDEELAEGRTKRHILPTGKTTVKLYHNKGDGTFEDVTVQAGLAIEMYGMGCAVGDYDNDGDDDLFVTALGRNYLFRNDGGQFTEVAERAGIKDKGWGTSSAFLDYDRDGDLDLFVCRYVVWTPAIDIWCTLDGKRKSYCTPEKYTGEMSQFFRNDGGRFTNITRQAGMDRTGDGKPAQGKSLGIAVCDYNNDGWPDLAVANDTEPNYLFRNNRDGTFSEVGVFAGIAYSEAGIARGAMGIDAGDYSRSGRESLLIGNFSNQMLALYHNESRAGIDFFVDKAPASEIGQKSRLYLAFGCFYFDYDNDGWFDIFVANGHVENDINSVQQDVFYEEEPLVFRNLGARRTNDREEVLFRYVGDRLGAPLLRKVVGRGCAYADYDNDGDLDVLITANGGHAYLLRDDGGSRNNKMRLHLRDARRCSAIGTKVRVKTGEEHQTFMVRSGSSYCSQSELPLTIGLGKAEKVDAIEIQWLTGKAETLKDVPANQVLTVTERKGITEQKGFSR